MQIYQNAPPQPMLNTQPRSLPLTQQLPNSPAYTQTGQSRHAAATRYGQPVVMQQPRHMMMQQPLMMVRNRSVIMYPGQTLMMPQQYHQHAAFQQYAQQYQAPVTQSASVDSEPGNRVVQGRNSNPPHSTDDAQPKSHMTETDPTSLPSNPAELPHFGVTFKPSMNQNSSEQSNQLNNSGQTNLQSGNDQGPTSGHGENLDTSQIPESRTCNKVAKDDPPTHTDPEEAADVDLTPEEVHNGSPTFAVPTGDAQNASSIDAASQLQMLKTKQDVMECVMKKLLRSMKQIQDSESEEKERPEVEAEHRLKMARMMQLLMLQRKNLQQQVDTLSGAYSRLLQKHECLKTYSEACVAETLDLNKKCRKLQTEQDNKESQIKALMQLSCKLQQKLEGQAHTELALENTSLEIRRLICDNETLKAANKQLEETLAETTKERESLILQNSRLKMDLDRTRVELANQRVRIDKISAENAALRNQLSLAEAGSYSAAKKSVEYDQLREAYENLQFDHQRLQMLYISETETRRDLHNQLQEVSGNIRVISRFRPPEECDDGNAEFPFEFCAMDKIFVCGKFIPATITYQRQLGLNQPQAYSARDEFFAFNRVFQDTANQEDIFEEIRPMIASFVDGYNVCILAYGPTGSGKTYTMQGTKDCPGMCGRAVTEVFSLCDPLQGVWCTEINIAMFEIHNEIIYDLLAPQITPVKLCDNGSDVRLINAQEKITTSEHETMYWIEKGYVRRKVCSTRLNSESSRSHLIIRMHLSLVSMIDNQRRTSSLVLCDLAGSESAERIEANEILHMETGYINRSLVTLSRVFETLRRRSGHSAPTGLAIPYRDSKLTHLLKPCLGGQAKCVLIVTASPEHKHLDRTLKALEFAQRAMQVSLGRPNKNNRILVSSHTSRS
ncbi:hypothetical protein Aperf_G00000090904 [Anoplocephala perfoliata]